jgi:hypothetical protein
LLAAGVAVFESDDELVDADVDAGVDDDESEVDVEGVVDDEAAASELFLESRLSVR